MRSGVTAGLAIAWLGSFALQGLVGSFEHQRHLWILFGLILSARQLEQGSLRRPLSNGSLP
jgi:hypothetical protein